MATRPATAPDAAPSVVAWPDFSRSTMSQPSIAAAAATNVFRNACAATPLAASAEPALKPNHPNHRMPVPSSVSGNECGGIGSPGQPRRLPRMSTSASAPAPALTWTTVPPAKSSAPRSASQPPANTQWATGRYTRIDHRVMKPTHADPAHAVGDGAGDQRGRDDGERQLERHERQRRDRARQRARSRSFSPTKSKLPIRPPLPGSPKASE